VAVPPRKRSAGSMPLWASPSQSLWRDIQECASPILPSACRPPACACRCRIEATGRFLPAPERIRIASPSMGLRPIDSASLHLHSAGVVP